MSDVCASQPLDPGLRGTPNESSRNDVTGERLERSSQRGRMGSPNIFRVRRVSRGTELGDAVSDSVDSAAQCLVTPRER